MFARKVRCGACGAPKITTPRTAYVYCDYCGALMDWDFQIACQTAGSSAPGPAYEALRLMLHPKLEAARLARDVGALREAHARLLDLHMTDCPASYSPRIGDPAYREALLAYQVAYIADAELDPDVSRASKAVDVAAHRLAWIPGPNGTRLVRTDTFVTLWHSFRESTRVNERLIGGRDITAGHPDSPSADLLRRMGDSIFVQAWLPVLDPATAAGLLAEAGLKTEYEPVPDVPLHDRRCAQCAATVQVPEGARRAICESCGHALDVEHPIFCPHCGGPLAFPAGKTAGACAYCQAEVRLM